MSRVYANAHASFSRINDRLKSLKFPNDEINLSHTLRLKMQPRGEMGDATGVKITIKDSLTSSK